MTDLGLSAAQTDALGWAVNRLAAGVGESASWVFSSTLDKAAQRDPDVRQRAFENAIATHDRFRQLRSMAGEHRLDMDGRFRVSSGLLQLHDDAKQAGFPAWAHVAWQRFQSEFSQLDDKYRRYFDDDLAGR